MGRLMKFFTYPKVSGIKNLRLIDVKYVRYVFDRINQETFGGKIPKTKIQFSDLCCAADTLITPKGIYMRLDNSYKYCHETDNILLRLVMHEMVHIRILSKIPNWLSKLFFWIEGPYQHGVIFHTFMWYYSTKMWGFYKGADYLFGDFFMNHHP